MIVLGITSEAIRAAELTTDDELNQSSFSPHLWLDIEAALLRL